MEQQNNNNKLCARPPQYSPAPCKLTFDLFTLKVVSKSRVISATSVPILVFLCLCVLVLRLMYVTDRQTSDAHHHLMPPALGAGHNNKVTLWPWSRTTLTLCKVLQQRIWRGGRWLF